MLLKDGQLATLDPPRVATEDLRIQGDQVVERGSGLTAGAGEEVVDLAGALVLPGLVNAHTHLYSGLARGMPGGTPPRSFQAILEGLWWRLDRALDEEAVRLSALLGAVEAARSGVTVLIDHHSSPGFIRGSLATLRSAIEEVGLRAVLCYETTDRNGVPGRDLGIEENRDFRTNGQSPMVHGMIGGHASFTLSEQSLGKLAGAVRDTGSSLHVHVAEDPLDVEDCRRRHGLTLPDRLERHGLLLPCTILAHGIHLTAAQLEQLQAKGGWIAHCPRSNMNNAVGHAPTAALRRAALGTDGIDQDVLAEARAAFLKMRDAGRDDAFPAALELLAGGHRLASALFGLPFGRLGPGAPADLVVLDYPSPTPLRDDTLAGHLLFGVDRSHVSSVMVAGRFVVRDRCLPGIDVPALYARARSAAEALWRRTAALE